MPTILEIFLVITVSKKKFSKLPLHYNPGKKLVDFSISQRFPLPHYTMLLFMQCMLESDFILFNIVPGEGWI
jgi:hypothetical protein